MTDQSKNRRAMLAKIHLAVKDLVLEDVTYRDLLEAEFGVRSSAKLNDRQMDKLLGIFKQWGWRPNKSTLGCKALRIRAREIADRLPDGDARLAGLMLKICGVSRLDWAHDEAKLTRLLAALGKIERDYAAPPSSPKAGTMA